jgi:hypothetical protein
VVGAVLRSGLHDRAVCQIVLGQKRLFVEAEITGDRADKSAIENAARKFLPFFIFQGFKEAGSNARCRSNFFQRDFAQFTFALQTFSEISPGHALNL